MRVGPLCGDQVLRESEEDAWKAERIGYSKNNERTRAYDPPPFFDLVGWARTFQCLPSPLFCHSDLIQPSISSLFPHISQLSRSYIYLFEHIRVFALLWISHPAQLYAPKKTSFQMRPRQNTIFWRKKYIFNLHVFSLQYKSHISCQRIEISGDGKNRKSNTKVGEMSVQWNKRRAEREFKIS